MHRLLKRQIKKSLGEKYLEDTSLHDFFHLIDTYYSEIDKERRLLENALEVNSTELSESNEQLQKMAFYDALTGLTNRKLFEKEVELTIKQLQRHKRHIAILFFDLDNFKSVNDTLGHNIGDALLIKVSRLIESRIRECDILARWGGDEFVLLLDELAHIDDCTVIVQNIQDAFKDKIQVGEHKLKVTFSIGINLYEDGENMSQMIKNADMAMYTAKESGKNSFAFYTSSIGEQVIADMKLDLELIEAIKKREFIVLYQPQVDIKTGNIVGAEALVRWNHQQNGISLPYTFIEFAEEKGHIIDIGKQVLEQSCIDMKHWIESGYTINNISVNLSVKQLRNKQFISSVQDILRASKLDASYLEFEVTETMIMKEYEHAFDTLETLRSIGIALSIDDFGTGYSSLSYLKTLPIDKIKIDKSFIDEIANNNSDIAITKAIISMSHSLGLKVLAEGIEKKSQLDILHALKCEEYQGYYFSKPIPAEEFEKLLKNQKSNI